MGILTQLEIENFKSYKGKQIIGPFKRFTAIIGPNGSGKSNLMDAICFVLGEKTSNLRVRSVKNLIHGAPIHKPVSNKAQVTAVYTEEDETEIRFTRCIVGSGTEYRINNKVIDKTIQYQEKLENLGISIKARNFLVFQGTVESIALKTPKERTQLFEQISGSGELQQDYLQTKSDMQSSEEDTTFHMHKKKGISAERRAAKAEKEEADKYLNVKDDLSTAQVHYQLFKLLYNEKKIENLSLTLDKKEKEVAKMESRCSNIEQQLRSKKQESAKVSREIAVLDKKIQEKEAEAIILRPQYIKAKEKSLHLKKRIDGLKYVP
ncbi:uncharacterized protein TRIADDRAFT_25837 [Trichoplax adhaerens]|uniref:RecF/RecN/SMC N-terminal domain-containing protein n=1 Tax=Trichoplax adhaerens TaxID=10228 RepID=B3RXV6_TRIAD|nr:hypothetical protein TRIADDRAFT_25837 [Trichoplax adhaerens]EDV24924.1 hypothetical protein TRIADDRAFT_25837 [Trichoplax adhaerens]|eukprot:XP_002112814.1 hypothetical protein TRIADDRAFT_25837 [Trichoplax adhaerens]